MAEGRSPKKKSVLNPSLDIETSSSVYENVRESDLARAEELIEENHALREKLEILRSKARKKEVSPRSTSEMDSLDPSLNDPVRIAKLEQALKDMEVQCSKLEEEAENQRNVNKQLVTIFEDSEKIFKETANERDELQRKLQHMHDIARKQKSTPNQFLKKLPSNDPKMVQAVGVQTDTIELVTTAVQTSEIETKSKGVQHKDPKKQSRPVSRGIQVEVANKSEHASFDRQLTTSHSDAMTQTTIPMLHSSHKETQKSATPALPVHESRVSLSWRSCIGHGSHWNEMVTDAATGVQKMVNRIEALKAITGKQEEVISNMTCEIQNLTENHQVEINELNGVVGHTERSLRQTRKQLDAVIASNEELLSENEDLNKNAEQQKQDIAILEESLDVQSKEKSENERTIKLIKGELITAQSDFQSLKSKNEEIQRKQKFLSEELDTTRAEKESACMEVVEMKKQVTKLADEISFLRDEKLQLTCALEEAVKKQTVTAFSTSHQQDEAKAKVLDLQKVNEQLHRKLRCMQDEKQHYSEEVRESRTIIGNLRAEIERFREMERYANGPRGTMNEKALYDELRKLKAELHDVHDHYKERERQFKGWKAQAELKLSQKDDEIARNEHLRNEIERLKENAKESRALFEKLKRSTTRHEAEAARYKKMVEELRRKAAEERKATSIRLQTENEILVRKADAYKMCDELSDDAKRRADVIGMMANLRSNQNDLMKHLSTERCRYCLAQADKSSYTKSISKYTGIHAEESLLKSILKQNQDDSTRKLQHANDQARLVQDVERIIEQLYAENDTLRYENDALRQDNSEMEALLNRALNGADKNIVNALQIECEDLKNELIKLNKTIKDLQCQNGDLEMKILDYKREHDDKNSFEQDQAEERQKALQHALEAANRERDSLEQKLRHARDHAVQANSGRSSCVSPNDHQTINVNVNMGHNSDSNNISSLQQQHDIDALKRERNALITEIDRLKIKKDMLLKEYERARSAMENETNCGTNNLHTEELSANAPVSEMPPATNSYVDEDAIKQLNDQNAKLRKKNKSLQQQFQSLKEELDECEESKSEMQKDAQQLRGKLKKERETAEELQEAINQSKELTEKQAEEIDTLKKQEQLINEKNSELQQKLVAQAADIESIIKDAEKLTTERNALLEKLTGEKECNKATDVKMAKLQEQIETMEEEIDTLISKIDEMKETEKQTKEKVEEYKTTIQELNDELEQRTSVNLENTIMALKNKLEGYEETMKLKDHQVESLKEKNQDMGMMASKLQGQISRLEQEIEQQRQAQQQQQQQQQQRGQTYQPQPDQQPAQRHQQQKTGETEHPTPQRKKNVPIWMQAQTTSAEIAKPEEDMSFLHDDLNKASPQPQKKAPTWMKNANTADTQPQQTQSQQRQQPRRNTPIWMQTSTHQDKDEPASMTDADDLEMELGLKRRQPAHSDARKVSPQNQEGNVKQAPAWLQGGQAQANRKELTERTARNNAPSAVSSYEDFLNLDTPTKAFRSQPQAKKSERSSNPNTNGQRTSTGSVQGAPTPAPGRQNFDNAYDDFFKPAKPDLSHLTQKRPPRPRDHLLKK